MRIAAAFILLISLAMAFKLEKEHPVFEDDPHEQYSPDEQYEPDEQDEPYELDEPAELYELDEPAERIEQEEDEDGNKAENLYERIFGQNYCCTHVCIVTPSNCF